MPATSCACEAVLLAGDFNHALREQCTDGAPGTPPPNAPCPYDGTPWLPLNAALPDLLDALRLGGRMVVERLSSDAPTNEDGTLDHLFVVTRAASGAHGRGGGSTYVTVTNGVVEDDAADVSDHLRIEAVVRRARAQPPAAHGVVDEMREDRARRRRSPRR